MDRKELVILAGNCFPICSATGSIAINFGNCLLQEYHVSMIVIEQEGFHYDGNHLGEFEVYSIRNWRLKWAQKAKIKRDLSKGVVSRFFNLSYQTARIVGRIQAMFFALNNNGWYKAKAYKVLDRIGKGKRIDAILTCAAPHEAHYVGRRYKENHPEVKWITYWGDLLSIKTNKVNAFISMQDLIKIEREICNASDYNLTTEENFGVLQNELENKNKIKALPYTLNQSVLDTYYDGAENNDGIISIIYMGSFYKEIRNPEYFLRLFADLDIDFKLFLFSAGNCEDIVEKYVRKSNGKIISCGQIPKGELTIRLKKADFLVNIENKLENSNPSKLLELISYGKPIIDFSFSESYSEALINYPYKLNVNMENDMLENIQIVEGFIKNNTLKRVDLKLILEMYKNNLESTVNQLILNVFKKEEIK